MFGGGGDGGGGDAAAERAKFAERVAKFTTPQLQALADLFDLPRPSEGTKDQKVERIVAFLERPKRVGDKDLAAAADKKKAAAARKRERAAAKREKAARKRARAEKAAAAAGKKKAAAAAGGGGKKKKAKEEEEASESEPEEESEVRFFGLCGRVAARVAATACRVWRACLSVRCCCCAPPVYQHS